MVFVVMGKVEVGTFSGRLGDTGGGDLEMTSVTGSKKIMKF